MKKVKAEITVIGNAVGIMRVGDVDYISITDLAKYANIDDPSGVIRNWMSNKNSFEFYGLWEELNNENFNSVEFHGIKTTEAPYNRFTMTSLRRKRDSNAIGISSGNGKVSNKGILPVRPLVSGNMSNGLARKVILPVEV